MIIRLIGVLLLTTFLNSFAQEHDSCHTRYFASLALRESPYPAWQGIVSLTREEALLRKHYRFTYDDQQRLTSVSFWHRDHRDDPNHTANYFMRSSILQIDYEPGNEIYTYYDRFESPIALPDSTFREVYTLDQHGRRNGLRIENKEGDLIENRWGIARYEWTVEVDGAIVEDRFGLDGTPRTIRTGFPFQRIRLYYEPSGLLALMQNIDADGRLLNNETGVAQDHLQFDADGRWHGWRVLDADFNLKEGNGPGVAEGVNIPDEYGYETSLHYLDRHGEHIRGNYGFWVGRRTYDPFGNYDATWFEDPAGELTVNERLGYALADYTWDRSGRFLQSIAFFDANREPVLRKGGYHRMERTYNDRGLLATITFIDTDGRKVNRSDNGAAVYVFEYDERNRLLEVVRYPKDVDPSQAAEAPKGKG